MNLTCELTYKLLRQIVEILLILRPCILHIIRPHRRTAYVGRLAGHLRHVVLPTLYKTTRLRRQRHTFVVWVYT